MRTTRQTSVDHLVAELAACRHGVVTRRQLAGLGLSRTAIDTRIRAGRLHRVHRGVYAVGHPTLTRNGRFLAAVLACGEGAALSHLTAAVLWALLRERGPRIDVTTPRSGGRINPHLAIVHRSPLSETEVATKDGIRVTTPARTALDLAAVVSRRELERALDEAAYLGLDLSGLRPRAGRRGGAMLAEVMRQHHPGTTRTRSDLEEMMLRLCRRCQLPQPLCNQKLEGHEVDFVWPSQRLVVETDGWRAHGSRRAFEEDRRRDADLTTAGWRVVRITWRRLEREPGRVAAQLADLLGCAAR